VTHYLGGDNEKAIRDLSEALRLDPRTGAQLHQSRAAYKKLRPARQVVADDGEAIRLDSEVPEYYDNRGLSLAAMGEYDKAIAITTGAAAAPRPNSSPTAATSYHLRASLVLRSATMKPR